ncbi:transmembrane protease serine [Holotrichia oblita]|uniref:Transmembrane protease serine n=1 Tax=Holotrichia oblita TaxID=644536 RepID=A0ACB9SXK6_HOLOL|nr:transmembrane protease serine [Holotrichia oblita]
MGWKLTARIYDVRKSTLRRKVLEKNKVAKGANKGLLGGTTATFSPEVEKELVEQKMANRFFGFTPLEVRTLAYQLAKKKWA